MGGMRSAGAGGAEGGGPVPGGGAVEALQEGFRGALTVHTVVEQLVWAHKSGPAEAREIAKGNCVAHVRDVQVRAC